MFFLAFSTSYCRLLLSLSTDRNLSNPARTHPYKGADLSFNRSWVSNSSWFQCCLWHWVPKMHYFSSVFCRLFRLVLFSSSRLKSTLKTHGCHCAHVEICLLVMCRQKTRLWRVQLDKTHFNAHTHTVKFIKLSCLLHLLVSCGIDHLSFITVALCVQCVSNGLPFFPPS